MPNFIVIDTESNGLFDFTKPADAEGQPRLAELAMLTLDADLKVIREFAGLVKPDGWVMHPEASAVNGLTTDQLLEHGRPVAEVLAEYTAAIDAGHAVAAFNAQHDCKMMRAELRRAGIDDRFERTLNFCCMRKSNGVILKASGKKGWPSLDEAKARVDFDPAAFGVEGKHRALADAYAAYVILKHLRDHGVDLTPEVHFKNQAPGKSGKTAETAQYLTGKPAAAPAGNVADQDIPR